jgi:hypothetical protein
MHVGLRCEESAVNKQLLERAAELARRGESFALAVVVATRRHGDHHHRR